MSALGRPAVLADLQVQVEARLVVHEDGRVEVVVRADDVEPALITTGRVTDPALRRRLSQLIVDAARHDDVEVNLADLSGD